VQADRGAYEEAERLGRDALSIAQEIGDRRWQAICLQGLRAVQAKLGAYEEAEWLYGEALRIAKEIGERRSQAGCLHGLGSVQADRGAYEEAERLLGDAHSIANEIGAMGEAARSGAERAVCLLRLSRVEEAGAAAREAVRRSEETRQADAQVAPLIALALCGGGGVLELEAAKEAAERAVREARRLVRPYDECRALLAFSEVLSRGGDMVGSQGAVREAEEIAGRHGMGGLLARAQGTEGASVAGAAGGARVS
jgi:tetratricopeptide (TPR) repeat protein